MDPPVDDGSDARFSSGINAIAEREKGVFSHHDPLLPNPRRRL